MNKTELYEVICENVRNDDNVGKVSAQTIEAVVTHTFNAMRTTLKDVHTISIRKFGVFSMKRSEARKGRNPRTGAELNIPAKNRVGFKPADAFVDELNK